MKTELREPVHEPHVEHDTREERGEEKRYPERGNLPILGPGHEAPNRGGRRRRPGHEQDEANHQEGRGEDDDLRQARHHRRIRFGVTQHVEVAKFQEERAGAKEQERSGARLRVRDLGSRHPARGPEGMRAVKASGSARRTVLMN